MPTEILKHWSGGRSYVCEGPDCTFDHDENPPRTRWRFEATSGEEKKLWDMSNEVWEQLEAVAEEPTSYQGLTFRVTRKGIGFDTDYIIVPSDQRQVSSQPQTVDDKIQLLSDLALKLNKPVSELYSQFIGGPGQDWAEATDEEQLDAIIPWVQQLVENYQKQANTVPTNHKLAALFGKPATTPTDDGEVEI